MDLIVYLDTFLETDINVGNGAENMKNSTKARKL